MVKPRKLRRRWNYSNKGMCVVGNSKRSAGKTTYRMLST